jgi:hypothetical protein
MYSYLQDPANGLFLVGVIFWNEEENVNAGSIKVFAINGKLILEVNTSKCLWIFLIL